MYIIYNMMAKKKHNTPSFFVLPANYFTDGGEVAPQGTNVNSGKDLEYKLEQVSGLLGAFTQNAKIADTNEFEEQLRASSNRIIKPLDNDALMQEYDTWNPFAYTNQKEVRGSTVAQRSKNVLKSAGEGASIGSSVAGPAAPVGALIGAIVGAAASGTAWIAGDQRANKRSKSLNRMIDYGNQRRLQTLENAAQNLDRNQDLQMQSTFYRNGGRLNLMANGGHTNGAMWDNGLTHFNEGGNHTENPFGGIVIGADAEGTPNLVEEGEVKWKDYIFSNSLKAKEKDLKVVGLHSKYAGKTFAEISKKISKESEERPNDPISKRGLEIDMTRLSTIQEEIRNKKQTKSPKGNMFFLGGPEDPNAPFDEYLAMEQGVLEDPQYAEKLAAARKIQSTIGMQTPEVTTPEIKGGKDKFSLSDKAHLLRYAPAIGNAAMSLTDALGITNKPNTAIARSLDNVPQVEFSPVGNYLAYNPLDVNYHRNNLLAQASATRRALMSDISPSRGANIVAADYNANMALGNLARQAEEYNLAQRAKVEEFNRGTNMFNSEGVMKAAQANAEMRMRAKLAQAELINKERERSSAAKSANLSNLFESLSGIGREQTFLNSIKSDNTLYYERLPDGTIRYKNAYHSLSPEEKKKVDAQIKIGK